MASSRSVMYGTKYPPALGAGVSNVVGAMPTEGLKVRMFQRQAPAFATAG